MHSTSQLGHLGRPLAYTVLPRPDDNGSSFPITVWDPPGPSYFTVLQSPYESEQLYYGVSFHGEDLDGGGYLDVQDQGYSVYPYPPASLLKSDMVAGGGGPGSAANSHLRHQTSVDFSQDVQRHRNPTDTSSTFLDWVCPPPEDSPTRTFAEDMMHWGSDSMFDAQARAQARVGVRQMTQFRLKPISDDDEDDAEEEEEEDADGQEQEDDDEEDEAQTEEDGAAEGAAAPAATGSKSEQAARSPGSATARKRIGGAARGNKPKRVSTDNQHSATASDTGPSTAGGSRETKRGHRKKLTTEQKRSNHIRHEKKRRALIRDGFDDLTELVPALRGGTWSRSRILFKAVEWLQTILERNEALQQRLDALEGTGTQNKEDE